MTRSRDAQGLGLTADAVRYLRALLRRSLGPLGHIRIASLRGGRAPVRAGRREPEHGDHRRVERRAGPALAIACQQDNVKFPAGVGGLWPHGAVTGRISDLSHRVPGWANFIQILRKNIISLIGQRTAFTFTLRTAESYMLSRRCMYGEKHHDANNKNRSNLRAHRGSPSL